MVREAGAHRGRVKLPNLCGGFWFSCSEPEHAVCPSIRHGGGVYRSQLLISLP